jgi:hypothetical protein
MKDTALLSSSFIYVLLYYISVSSYSSKNDFRQNFCFFFTDPDYVFSGCRDFQKCIAESFEAQAEFVSRVLYIYSDLY